MSPKRGRCAAVLPDHLIEEILLRLPAKSVLRCRQLSRAWAATLSSPDFEDLYLRVANNSGPRIFGVQEIWRPHAQEPNHVLPPLTSAPRVIKLDGFRRQLATSLPPTTEEEEDQGKPPGHVNASAATAQCRGLVVLRAFADGTAPSPDMYYVCNPSTGRMAALPVGRTTGFRGSPSGDSRERYASLGLGYDVRTGKHKVVRVCHRGPRSTSCEVYVVNGPKASWWPVEIGEKPMGWNWIDPCANSVFAQGHVYWLAYRELHPRRQGMFLVSFSLRDDKLGIIRVEPPFPSGMENQQRAFFELMELRGRLCLFDPCFTHSDGPHYDIWELNQHGSGLATWDLHYRIDLAEVPLEVMRFGATPLAITDNGRRLVFAETEAPDQIYSHDSVTNDIEELLDWSGQPVTNPTLGLTHANVYEESIVSPGRQPCKDTVLISSPSTQALSLVLQSGWLSEEHTVGRLMCVCRSWRSMICCQLLPRYN